MPQVSQQVQDKPFLVSVEEAIAQLENELKNLREVRDILSRPRPKVGVPAPARIVVDTSKATTALAKVTAAASPRPASPVVAIPPPAVKPKRGRKPLMLTYKDRTLSINQWAEETGRNVETIRYRYKCGWPIEKILGAELHTRANTPSDPEEEPGEPDKAHIDIDARSAGIATVPGLQAELDKLEGKPVVLPKGMNFVFDPKAPAETCIPSLKAETARRQNVKGGRQSTVEFITTASSNHVHIAVLDHFGDGQTKVDAMGHVHRLCRWKMIEAHKHEHGLAMTPPGVGK